MLSPPAPTQDYFGNRGLLWFHINFWIIYSSSVEDVMGNCQGIALTLQIAMGTVAILTI